MKLGLVVRITYISGIKSLILSNLLVKIKTIRKIGKEDQYIEVSRNAHLTLRWRNQRILTTLPPETIKRNCACV